MKIADILPTVLLSLFMSDNETEDLMNIKMFVLSLRIVKSGF